MKKMSILIVLLMAAGTLTVAPAHAEEKRYDATTKTCRPMTMPNLMVGYKSFRTLCKSCHNRKSNQGKFLQTESKVPTAWNRVFAEKYPKCAKNGAWKDLSLDDQLKLNDYLFMMGSGTYDPKNAARCG